MEENMQLTRERVLEELVAIGFARVTDYFFVEEDGTLRPKLPLDGSADAAVAALETTGKGIKVKFYDKLKALDLLGKHLGMFSGKEAEPEKEENNLLEAILQATRGEVDIHDIPELQQAAADRHELVEPTAAEPA